MNGNNVPWADNVETSLVPRTIPPGDEDSEKLLSFCGSAWPQKTRSPSTIMLSSHLPLLLMDMVMRRYQREMYHSAASTQSCVILC